MKSILSLALVVSLGSVMVTPSGAQTMAPPIAAPKSLPPLPPGGLKLPSVLAGPLPSSVPVAPSLEIDDGRYNASAYARILGEETDRISDAVSPALNVRLSGNGQGDGRGTLAEVPGRGLGECMITVGGDGESVWKTYAQPLNGLGDGRSWAAFLVGRATATCLDRLDRNARGRDKARWSSTEVGRIGIASEAIGKQITREAVLAGAFDSHPAQVAYAARVADIFGALWMIKLGATQAQTQALASIVGGQAVAIAEANRGEAMRLRRADTLFELARRLQAQGWSWSAVAAPASAAQASTPGATPVVAQWVVTPRGPVAYDKNGVEIPMEALRGVMRDFNDTKRFGDQ